MAIGGLPKSHEEVFSKRGWMVPFLLAYDDLLWGRWSYWLDICQKGTITGSAPIPQLKFSSLGEPGVVHTMKMFEKCLHHSEATIDNFADWLLWALAETQDKPNVSARLNEYYYKHFDLFLVLNDPTDYLSAVLSEQTGRGYKSGLGYFPTPMHVVELMTQITFAGGDREAAKRQTLSDPCVGCGAMLLPASNYVLRAYAMDISQVAIKLCRIQMKWYAPWFSLAPELDGFDEEAPQLQLTLSTSKKAVTGQLAFQF